MIFGKTWDERKAEVRTAAARRRAQAKRGKFVLFPRRLNTGRWAWLERLPYRDVFERNWDQFEGIFYTRTREYYPPGTVLE